MFLMLTTLALAGNPMLNDPSRSYEVQLDAEIGFLAPVHHTLQFSRDGDKLDYVSEGGQDNLFAIQRYGATVRHQKKHFTLLWQPLDLQTTVKLDRDHRVDGVVFPAERPMDLRYGFSFWRLSWGRQVLDRENLSMSAGLGFQIRNATISFTSVDGSLSETNRDVGPVPLLEWEMRRTWDNGGFLEIETDGFYAPIKYLNGRNVDVIGAIADFQVRAGLELADPIETFVGLRYLGGGSSGTGTPDGTGDGYNENWLHFLTVTVGMRVR